MSSARRLGDVLGALLDESPFRERADAVRVMEAWPEVVGGQIAGMTEVQRFRAGTLFVEVDSAPWRQALHLQRGQWRSKLNEHLGKSLVDEVVFR